MAERFVYFIKPVGQDGPIKIGVANNPEQRLTQIKCWSPVALEIAAVVPGDHALERVIHECFAHAHSHGEWFSPVEALIRGVARIKMGVSVEEAFDLSKRTGYHRRSGPGRKTVRHDVLPDDHPFQRAIALAGSENKLAALIGYSQHAVWNARVKSKPSAAMAKAIERATGVPAALFRPELFTPTGD